MDFSPALSLKPARTLRRASGSLTAVNFAFLKAPGAATGYVILRYADLPNFWINRTMTRLVLREWAAQKGKTENGNRKAQP
jgi:hypothetical protein